MAIVISGSGIDMGGNPVSNASQIDGVVINENGENVATEVVVNEQISNATKIGTIITFPINSVPTGFLECNGALLSRTAYANLFAVIGTTYGAGDGSTTFAIPDLRGEFIRGWDNGRGIDSGRTIGSYQADAFKSHTHTSSAMESGNQRPVGGGSYESATAGFTTGATGGNETRPRNIAMMYCIKY